MARTLLAALLLVCGSLLGMHGGSASARGNRYPSQITLSSDTALAYYPDPFALRARVTSDGETWPAGTVTFSANGSAIATEQVHNGSAILQDPYPDAYTSPITFTATYSGDSVTAGSSASLVQRFAGGPTQTSLSSSLNPASVGATITFTATVSGADAPPRGQVIFEDGNTELATNQLNASTGIATYTTSSLTLGNHTITALFHYSVGQFSGSSASLVQQVTLAPL
jgi:hypothetical protein